MTRIHNGVIEPATIFSVDLPASTKVVIFHPTGILSPAPSISETALAVGEALEIAANVTLELTDTGVALKKSYELERLNVIDTNSLYLIPTQLIGLANTQMVNSPNAIRLKLNLLLTKRVRMQIFTA